MTETVELENFEKLIESHVEPKVSRGEPAFISAIGIALGSDLQRLKAVSGLSLRDFITERMSDRYRLIEVKPNTTGVWRADEAYNGNQIDPPEPKAPRIRIPRYGQPFWQAFANPLTSGRRFYDPVSKEIRTAEVPASEQWIEIAPTYIRSDGEDYDPSVIANRIGAWFKDTKLDPVEFRSSRPLQQAASVDHTSVLELLISSLDGRQLRSVTISLDVVSTLMRKSV